MPFNVSNVEPLAWSFAGAPRNDGTAFGPEAHGVVPEPTRAALQRFADALTAASKAEPKDGDDGYDELLKVVGGLCDGSPSVEDLAQLPPRYFSEFCSWLREELFAPKA